MTDKALYLDPNIMAKMFAAKRAGTWKPTWQKHTRPASVPYSQQDK